MFIVPCPSCGRCGCECGRLPYTVTATFADLSAKNRTAECDMVLTACFGSGAAAVVMQPGGCSSAVTCSCEESDAGPITEVLLTAGGSCYAVYGREEPEVTAAVAGDSDATFTVTLTESVDDCGLPVWSVSKVNVVEPGNSYAIGQAITLTVSPRDFQDVAASAEVATLEALEPPELTLISFDGFDGVFDATLTQSGSEPDRWEISSVAVTSGGSSFPAESFLFVQPALGLVEETAAVLKVLTERTEPVLIAFPSSGGSGADIAITLTQSGSNPDLWSAASISVTSPGSGYLNGDTFTIVASFGVDVSTGTATATVNDSGGLVSLAITSGGQFFSSTGVAESVDIDNGGSYYVAGGIESVTVIGGGAFYRQNKTLAPHVAEVTVTPEECGGGSGAVITATVDDDVASDTFGEVVSLSIDDGGDDYLSWTWAPGCFGDRLNGESLVLVAQSPHVLVTLEVQSCYGSGACLEVKTDVEPYGWDGAATALPGVILTAGGSGYARLGRVEPTLSLTATPGNGVTLTPTLDSKTDDCGLDYWYIDSVATAGGTGYLDASNVKITATKGFEEEPAALTLVAKDGVPTTVNIDQAGKYYLESKSVAAYTPTLTVTVVQLPPSNGSNAAVSVTIETDPFDDDFGEITAVTLTNQGSGYSLLGGPKNCSYQGACGAALSFSGLSVMAALGGTFEQSASQPDCDDISFSAEIQRGLNSGSVTVEPGGLWGVAEDLDCGDTCTEDCEEEITVTVSVCGETITLTMPIPGSASFQSVLPGEDEGFILIEADNACDATGCGWTVTVSICSQCADEPPRNVGEGHRGCVAVDENGCPASGSVTMVCLNESFDPPLECFATVSVTVG